MNQEIPHSWWESLTHGGLVLSPSQVPIFSREIESISKYHWDRFRGIILKQEENEDQAPHDLIQYLFYNIIRNQKGKWLTTLDSSWGLESRTGKIIKPWHVWKTEAHEQPDLPVFLTEKKERGARHPLARNRKFLSRVLEWMRKKHYPYALVTNGKQFRFFHAGPDYESFFETDTDYWFEEGRMGSQLYALCLLFADLGDLFNAVSSSKGGQAELSRDLGERVRRAVELLIKESAGQLDSLKKTPDLHRGIYLAAVRMIMRCVVVLFAESRDLLPLDNPVYASSYSLEGLRDSLNRKASTRHEALNYGRTAWPRMLSLFNLIYRGSRHQALPLPAYGGGLFQPGDKASNDPLEMALGYLEDPEQMLSDSVIYQILDLLAYAHFRTKQWNRNIRVKGPVNFSDLSSEYIGILYEGLLDYELRKAPDDDAVVFINAGNQPALELSRLSAMSNKELKNLFSELKKEAKAESASGGEEDSPEIEDQDEELLDDEEEDVEEINDSDEMTPESPSAQYLKVQGQLAAWKFQVASLLEKAQKKSESDHQYRERLEKAADALSVQDIMPGQWFLVRWGGTRKGAGTFYTPPKLVEPTVRRSLEPLLYEVIGSEQPIPKKPEEILDLKVADISMGSGSFLIGALRELVDTLIESLYFHERLIPKKEKTICRLADGQNGEVEDDIIPVPPEHDSFEERLRVRLKRHVVERCIYGVDLDPLAVDLARLSLWVETMDYELPFSFLDHKLKMGNSIVGTRFECLGHYPLQAFQRKGPDYKHPWTSQYSIWLKERLRHEVRHWIDNHRKDVLQFEGFSLKRSKIRERAFGSLEKLHHLRIGASEERQKIYQREIMDNPDFQHLHDELDLWCALWFWPGDVDPPGPNTGLDLSSAQRKVFESIRKSEHFFHWELEFPDVFQGRESGFDALVGNPPWDTWKPNSKEFFSNIDPLYRIYGKQEALRKQNDYFRTNPELEHAWWRYQDRFRAISNYTRLVCNPWGDPKGESKERVNLSSTGRNKNENELYHELWRTMREKNRGYQDPGLTYIRQGGGDVNSYKLFLEQSHHLLKKGGQLGMIVPGSIYSDDGSTALRKLFLNHCHWRMIFGFENRKKIFNIHSSYKFCAVLVHKGAESGSTQVSFMNRDLEAYNTAQTIPMTPEQVARFSPQSLAFLEIRGERDLQILEKIYTNPNVVLLGDESDEGWGVKYGTEFHMTNDSRLFPPIAKWEAQGYRDDEYGHWLKGDWQSYSGPIPVAGMPSDPSQRPANTVLSQDYQWIIDLDTLEGVALPLYQGVMINHFDFAAKRYVRGAGNRAEWDSQDGERKIVRPQFLMGLEDYAEKAHHNVKLLFRDISNATNQRTFIGAVCPDWPAGNTTPTYSFTRGSGYVLGAYLSSFIFDFILRIRMTGTHLNSFIMEELPVQKPVMRKYLHLTSQSLSAVHQSYFPWSDIKPEQWILNDTKRRELRAEIDAKVAQHYGLSYEDLAYILGDCDHPVEKLRNKAFTRALDPRGFWRVDKELLPEERHTVMTLKKFRELEEEVQVHYPEPGAMGYSEAAEKPGESFLVQTHKELIARIRSFAGPGTESSTMNVSESVPVYKAKPVQKEFDLD